MRFSQSSARYYQLEDDLLCWHVFKGFVSSLVCDSVHREARDTIHHSLDSRQPGFSVAAGLSCFWPRYEAPGALLPYTSSKHTG